MKFTRDITKGEYVQLCRGLGCLPDTNEGGGFLVLNTHGRYKAMRHHLINSMGPAYWPQFNPKTVMEEWKENTDILVSNGTHGHTYLKAFDGASEWTMRELTFYRTILANYGILTDIMPKPNDLIYIPW